MTSFKDVSALSSSVRVRFPLHEQSKGATRWSSTKSKLVLKQNACCVNITGTFIDASRYAAGHSIEVRSRKEAMLIDLIEAIGIVDS